MTDTTSEPTSAEPTPTGAAAAPESPTPASAWATRLARRAQGGPSELAAVLALSGAGGDLVDFSGGFPDPTLFDTGLLAELAAKAIETRPEVSLQYASNLGLPSLREALRADFSRTQSRVPEEDELIVTSGGVDAMTLLSKALLDPGDAVLVESPSYLGAFGVFRTHEGVCVPMAGDAAGLDPDSIGPAVATARARGAEPKMLYVIPDFQNPSGLWLSTERRQAIIDAARRHGLLIIEDVAYRDLAFDGTTRPSIWELGPDVTVQIGTFSKTFTPGTRMGWAAGPAPVIAALAEAKTNTDQCAGALGQCILEDMLRTGHYTQALPGLREAYGQRGRALIGAFAQVLAPAVPDATWTEPAGGFFTWVRLPGIDTKELATAAASHGVAFVPGSPFYADARRSEHLRMSFSRTPIERMPEGVTRLVGAIESVR
jgi:2-aminoadipate transaminase